MSRAGQAHWTSMTPRKAYSTSTPQKPTHFDGNYLRKRSTLDIGVLGYIGIVWPKEHSPEVWSVPPVTPCMYGSGMDNVWSNKIFDMKLGLYASRCNALFIHFSKFPHCCSTWSLTLRKLRNECKEKYLGPSVIHAAKPNAVLFTKCKKPRRPRAQYNIHDGPRTTFV